MGAFLRALLAACAIGVATLAWGAEPQRPRTDASPATLVVFNRPVMTFRGPLLGMSPTERAEASHRRIQDMLAVAGRRHEVTVQTVPQGQMVALDGTYAFIVTPGDIEPLTADTPESVAARSAALLQHVVEEVRERRDTRALLHAGSITAAVTLAYLLVMYGLRRLRRALQARLVNAAAASTALHRMHLDTVLKKDWLVAGARLMVFVLWACLALLVTYEWLTFGLRRFPHTRAWGERLNDFLQLVATDIGGGIVRAIPNMFVALLIFLIARFVARMVTRFLAQIESGAIRVEWMEADLAAPTRKLALAVIWLFALAMVYPYLPGSDTEAFKGLSVLAGLMVSLGASSIVGQAASGLILMFTRTFRPGDYVRVADHEGTVMEIGTFTTRILTGMGEELVLPNSLVLGNASRNYSRIVRGKGFILSTKVTIGYDAPWRQVHAMLATAASRTPGVLTDPAPRIYQTALSDFYAEYLLVCQAVPSEPAPRAQVMSALNANIQDVFNEYGVQIMSPHYFADPPHAKVVPKSGWFAPPAIQPAEADGVTITRSSLRPEEPRGEDARRP